MEATQDSVFSVCVINFSLVCFSLCCFISIFEFFLYLLDADCVLASGVMDIIEVLIF